MSASTSATRRRTSSAISGDLKQAVEILNETTISSIINKDLERKSQLPTNSNRTRNPKVKPKRSILSVFVKHLLLLIVLLGLIQMISRLVADSGNGLKGFSYLEGRIAQMESSLKTMAKILQVQVEVVDKKVESLFGDVKRDLSGRIDERTVEMGRRLSEFEERAGVLEAGLRDLRSKDLLTKEDLVELYEEYKKGKGNGGVDEGELGLDEIRGLVREVVRKEIEKHAADGLGMVDYAAASGGGIVVRHSKPWVVSKIGNWFSRSNWVGVHRDADKMLNPSFGEPGQCFPLNGSSGFVEIRLRTAIVPDAVTLEHVDQRVAFDRTSAPKHCRVTGLLKKWGHQQDLDTELTADSEKLFLLTEFTYDLEKSNAQTFSVFKSASSAVTDTVRFDFSSNHGNPSFTCIYRFRVHGHEPNSLQVIDSNS